MQSGPSHSGEMSQDSERGRVHRSDVPADAPTATKATPAAGLTRAVDPAARASKRMYDGLSASSAGLELGIAVALGALGGFWLDGKLGSEPWCMLGGLLIGVFAGFRGLLRAVARAEKAAARE